MIRQHVSTWWTGLGRRERVMVLIAVTVVAFGLLYAIAISPALETRNRLTRELPQLHEELVEIESLRAEALQLAGRAGAVISAESLRNAAEQSVLRANLVAEVGTDASGLVSVTARNVSATVWLVWLESFTRETRASVQSAGISRSADGGRVEASVSFRAQGK